MLSSYVPLHIASPTISTRLQLSEAFCLEGSRDKIIWCHPKPAPNKPTPCFLWGILLLISIRCSHWLLPTPPLFIFTSTFWYPPAAQTIRGRQMVTGHLENLPLLKQNVAQETEYLMTDSSKAGRIVSNWTDTRKQWKNRPHGGLEDKRSCLSSGNL